MVADGTKGISSTPSTQQTNLDDWKKMIEQRGEETHAVQYFLADPKDSKVRRFSVAFFFPIV